MAPSPFSVPIELTLLSGCTKLRVQFHLRRVQCRSSIKQAELVLSQAQDSLIDGLQSTMIAAQPGMLVPSPALIHLEPSPTSSSEGEIMGHSFHCTVLSTDNGGGGGSGCAISAPLKFASAPLSGAQLTRARAR